MPPSSPQRMLNATLLAASVLMAGLCVAPYLFHLRRERLNAHDAEFAELTGRVYLLDEVLTMSARMGASTGDPAWEARYRRHEPELARTLARLTELTPDQSQRALLRAVAESNTALVGLENASFRSSRRGFRERASALLAGPVYERHKAVYAGGLVRFMDARRAARAEEERWELQEVRAAFLACGAGVLLLAAVWVILGRFLQGVRAAEERAALLLALEHAATAILTESADPLESAPRAIEALCTALDWDCGDWWLLDKASGDLACTALWHRPGKDFTAFKEDSIRLRFRRGVGLPGRVLESGRAARIKDVVADANFPRARAAQECGLHGAAAFPIVVEGETVGVFEFFSSAAVAIDEQALATLESLGRVIGQRIKRSEAERALRASEARLARAQKMDSLGRLTSGIAHDFNNNLAAIAGLGGFLVRGLPPGSPEAADAAEIVSVTRRCAALTRQLLDFSRQDPGSPGLHDANALPRTSASLFSRILDARVRVTVSPAPEPLPIRVDPNLFGQALMNLAVNARDAMPGGGTLTLALRRDPPHAELVVADDGSGMSPEVLNRLFEPFFTTKPPGQGTGLGLSIVYSFVTASGGVVSARSTPGSGTAFILRFPLAEGQLEAPQAPAPAPAADGDGRAVLVVDDEPAVLRVTARQLEGAGYRVLRAGSADEALALLREAGGTVALAVCDMNMPGLDGPGLAKALRAMRPGLRVLFVSGLAPAIGGPAADAATAFLGKPYSAEELAAAAARLLSPEG